MAELYILGPAEIRNERGELEQSFLAGPKRLALLVYLLLSRPRGFHRRDSLLPIFWPEHGQKSARNALSNMLYHIRQTLSSSAIINRGSEEVHIQPKAFWSDVIAFENHINNDKHEEALGLYRGELLKGFFIPDASPEFEQWLDEERERFNSLATESAWLLADKFEKQKDYAASQKWARKASELNPLCEVTATRLVNLLDRTGDWKGAIAGYEEYATRMQKEFEDEPSEEFKALINDIQARGPISIQPDIQTNKKVNSNHANKKSKKSIAVLPFESLGLEKASTITDAIHSDILTRLSNVAGLHVISRTSVMRFRNPESPLPRIADELGVEWMLGGEVLESPGRIQVNIRLISGPEDRQVWAKSYCEELTADNLFQIQEEITKHITGSLKAQLKKEDDFGSTHRPTQDLESYCLHAQGRWFLDQRTESGMQIAIKCFKEAIARDNNFTLAWIGLADGLALMYEYGYERDESILNEADEAVQIAYNLDPDLAETHTTFALLHEARHQGPQAIRQYKRAISIRPSYAEAHNWLSWTSQLVGDKDEALRSAKKAVELNPLSLEALSNLSLSWIANGVYDQGIREARRIQQIQPEQTAGAFYEGVAQYHQGNFREAIFLLDSLSVPWAVEGPAAALALACIGAGDTKQANNILAELKKTDDYFAVALVHAALDDKETAIKELLKITDWNYWAVIAMHHLYPQVLSTLRSDARFHTIIHRVYAYWGIVKPRLTDATDTNGFSSKDYGSSASFKVLL